MVYINALYQHDVSNQLISLASREECDAELTWWLGTIEGFQSINFPSE